MGLSRQKEQRCERIKAKPTDELTWNITRIWLRESGGMRWLRRVTEENLILINYHKMVNSPEAIVKKKNPGGNSFFNGWRSSSTSPSTVRFQLGIWLES